MNAGLRVKPGHTFVVAAAVLVAYNLARSAGVFGPADGVVLLVISIAMIIWTLSTGLTQADLGIERSRVGSGLRTGGWAFAVVITVVAIGSLVPSTAGFLDDHRARISFAALVYEVLVSTLFLTAIPEELMFRGVLLGAGMRAWSQREGVIWSSLLFGLWHISPTLATMGGNDQIAEVTTSVTGRVLVVVGNVVVTAGAGLLFCWLRQRSRSVVAPIVAHLATNGVTLTVAWLVASGR